jgi:hypothetical protein
MKHFLLAFLIALTATVSSSAQTLQIDPMYIGGTATFEVQNGSPGAPVIICYSMNGSGPFSLSNGITFDLSMPIKNLNSFNLDSLGNGALGPLPVPSTAVVGMQVWFQGLHFDIWSNPGYSVTNMVPITVVQNSPSSLVAWGHDSEGQVADTPTSNDFTQVSAGEYHAVALKLDGSLVSWGRDLDGQVSNTPTANTFAQVEAGYRHSVALRSGGSLISWGDNGSGQVSNTPTTNDFTQVAAGGHHSAALMQ